PAALAVLLFVIVAAIALYGMRGSRRTDPAPAPEPPAAPPARHRPWGTVISVGLGIFWLIPVLVLVATALHNPAAAGSAGWWRPDGMGLGSFAILVKSWLWPALLGNLLVAGLATAMVVSVATP